MVSYDIVFSVSKSKNLFCSKLLRNWLDTLSKRTIYYFSTTDGIRHDLSKLLSFPNPVFQSVVGSLCLLLPKAILTCSFSRLLSCNIYSCFLPLSLSVLNFSFMFLSVPTPTLSFPLPPPLLLYRVCFYFFGLFLWVSFSLNCFFKMSLLFFLYSL